MWSLLWLPVFFMTTLVYVDLDNEESPVGTVKKSVSSFFSQLWGPVTIEDHLVIKDFQTFAIEDHLVIKDFQTVAIEDHLVIKDSQPVAIDDHLTPIENKDSQPVAMAGLQVRSFTVDYSRDTLLKDGKPFSFIGGDIHYFRVPRPYWRDRLSKMRAAGVDTLTTYIYWALHELNPGQYDFSGQYDFIEFLGIAKELDFNIILRPGPYISAEVDFGGYPSWLLTNVPDIQLRTTDPRNKYYLKRWLDVLMPKLVPLLYGNGGNIIMVQVENEFGTIRTPDKQYQKWLYDLMLSYVKSAAVLFTNDIPSVKGKGILPGILETTASGPRDSPMTSCSLLRTYQPRGPCVLIEFYTGYANYWGQDWNQVRTRSIVTNIETFLQHNVSFSIYMFHGGTNFRFIEGSEGTNFVLTSYDFDAPISEAGDLTSKYMAIRDTIKKLEYSHTVGNPKRKELDLHELTICLKRRKTSIFISDRYLLLSALHINCAENPYRKVGDLPAPSPKGNYGAVHLQPVCFLFNCPIGIEYSSFKWPVTFEALGQSRGFLSYSTTLDRTFSGPSRLRATVRDRATVLLDDVEVGVLQAGEMSEVVLPSAGRPLRLLVENMGHQFHQVTKNLEKGLVSNATVGGELVSNWTITGYPLYPEEIAKLNDMAIGEEEISFPAVFRGSFTLGEGETPLDTFLSMEDWGKGVAFINDIDLGKYWEIGPTLTLYVPAPYLRAYPAPNIVTIMELYKAHPEKTITFVRNPIYKGNFTYKFE